DKGTEDKDGILAQIKVPFRQRQSTREERLAEGDFEVSLAEALAAQGNMAAIVPASAVQKQYRDPVGGQGDIQNGRYYQTPSPVTSNGGGAQSKSNGHR